MELRITFLVCITVSHIRTSIYSVPGKTQNHLMTGKRRKMQENTENAGKLRKICIYRTEDIVLGVRWNCPHL